MPQAQAVVLGVRAEGVAESTQSPVARQTSAGFALLPRPRVGTMRATLAITIMITTPYESKHGHLQVVISKRAKA